MSTVQASVSSTSHLLPQVELPQAQVSGIYLIDLGTLESLQHRLVINDNNTSPASPLFRVIKFGQSSSILARYKSHKSGFGTCSLIHYSKCAPSYTRKAESAFRYKVFRTNGFKCKFDNQGQNEFIIVNPVDLSHIKGLLDESVQQKVTTKRSKIKSTNTPKANTPLHPTHFKFTNLDLELSTQITTLADNSKLVCNNIPKTKAQRRQALLTATQSCGYTCPLITPEEIQHLKSQVQDTITLLVPIQADRNKLLCHIAKVLTCQTPLGSIYIWSGAELEKSLFIELITKAFGNYCSLITSKYITTTKKDKSVDAQFSNIQSISRLVVIRDEPTPIMLKPTKLRDIPIPIIISTDHHVSINPSRKNNTTLFALHQYVFQQQHHTDLIKSSIANIQHLNVAVIYLLLDYINIDPATIEPYTILDSTPINEAFNHFISTKCIIGHDHHTYLSYIIQEYKDYCTATNTLQVHPKMFRALLYSKGFKYKTVHSIVYCLGIKCISD